METSYTNQEVQPQESHNEKPLKQSGLGIASFVISLINGLFVFGIIILSTIMEIAGVSEDSGAVALLGLGAILVIIINLVGLGLGIGGCFVKERKKLLSILGIIFNIVPMLILAILIMIGLSL